MAKDSTGTILLLGGAGLAAYGWYAGWFANFLPATAASPAKTPAAGGGSSSAPPPVPPLGTTVTTAADALAQVAAKDPYILPTAPVYAQLIAALPAGYQVMTTTDAGGVLLRQDVYAAVSTDVANRISRAMSSGASGASVQAAGLLTTEQIKQVMSNQGLSGLGDYRRHLAARTGRY